MFSFNAQVAINNDPVFNTPLTFIAVEANSTVALTAAGTPSAAQFIQIGFPDVLPGEIDWQNYEIGTPITLQNIGDKVYFKNSINTFTEDGSNSFKFATSGLFDCDGNIMSLMNYTDEVPYVGFAQLFQQAKIRKAPNLLAHNWGGNSAINMFRQSTVSELGLINATKVDSFGFRRMFRICNNLKKPFDVLPIRNLADSGASEMFEGCSTLSAIPLMNFKKVDDLSCQRMFHNCISITDASNCTISCDCAPSSFIQMFGDCSGLIYPCKLPTTNLDKHCYYFLFERAENLLIPPELPATTLANACYQHMFESCYSLQHAPELPALDVPKEAYCAMFKWCYSLKDMPKLPAIKVGYESYYSMFAYCENLTGYVDELPAISADQYCYGQMFYQNYGMKKSPKIKLQNIDVGSCEKMFFNCSGLIEGPELLISSLTTNTPYSEASGPNVGEKTWGALERMYYNCSSLSSITVNFEDWDLSGTTEWVTNVSNSGNFYCPSELSAEFGINRIPQNWTVISK